MTPGIWKSEAARIGAALVCAAVFLFLFVHLGAFPVSHELNQLSPMPDVEEYAWVALRFAQGDSPLMPIANELHPSRYSPVHPFLMSLWMRMHGGGLDALFSWPMVALSLALLFFNIAIIRLGLTVLSAVLFSWLFLLNVGGRDTYANVMSEGTIILLLSFALLSWSEALRHGQGEEGRQRWFSLLAAFLCGMAVGGIVAMRATMIFFAFAFPLHWMLTGGRRGVLPLALYILGGTAVALVSAAYVYHHAGIWGTAAYGHWVHSTNDYFFSLAHAREFIPGADVPRWAHDLEALLGQNGFLWNGRASAVMMLLVGGILGIISHLVHRWRDKADTAWAVAACLFLSALCLFAAHLFFRFHYFRFLAPMLPVLILFGIAGWEQVFRLIATATPSRLRLLIMGILPAWVLASPPALELVIYGTTLPRSTLDHARYIDDAKRRHQEVGKIVREWKCPLFVDQVSTMRARMLMGLENHPSPIAPIRLHNITHLDSHTVQFNWFPQIKEGQPVDQMVHWPRPPRSYMWDPETGEVQGELLMHLLRENGRFLFYFPEWSMPVEDLFGWCDQNGFSHKVIAAPGRWRLVLMEATATPP